MWQARRMQDNENKRPRDKSIERSQLPTNFATVIFVSTVSKLVNTCMHCGYCIYCAPSLVHWCRCLAARSFSAFNHSNIGNGDKWFSIGTIKPGHQTRLWRQCTEEDNLRVQNALKFNVVNCFMVCCFT